MTATVQHIPLARRAGDINTAAESGQRAMDAVAEFVFDLVGLATATGRLDHARLATEMARLAGGLHILNEELAEGGSQ